MRREDKNRIPPKLTVSLPEGYHLESVLDGYALYVSQPFGAGRMTKLVCVFAAASTPQEIEAAAREHHEGKVEV